MNICAECRRIINVLFLSSLVFFVITFNIKLPYAFLVLFLVLPLISSLGFWAGIIDVFAIVLPFLFLDMFLDNKYVLYLPVITNILIILNYRAERYMGVILSYSLLIFWSYISIINYSHVLDFVLIGYSIFNMVMNLKPLLVRTKSYNNAAFVSLSSIYDNEEQFKELVPMLKVESECSIRKAEINDIKNDEFLILFFDISYFFPNISTIIKIIKLLPKGNKRSVMLVYPTKIYPDNGYYIIYLIMILKGWRVRGRVSYNVGLSRLTTANINVAANKEMRKVINEASADVAEGHISALGNTLYFSPLIILGFIIQLFRVEKK